MKRAFTLIEALVVIAILAIIGLIALPNFWGGSHEADLTSATNQMVSVFRATQSAATTQAKGGNWGIYFSNTTDTRPFYAVFNGTSYSSSTVTSRYVLPATITFTPPAVGYAYSIKLSPFSGTLPEAVVVNLYVLSQPSLSSMVTISRSGRVDYVMPNN